MFWEASYTPSPHIEALLSKENLSLLEILDDEEILQECKSQNLKLVQFLNRPEILEELIMLITTEPPTDVAETIRFKHSHIACEILTSDLPSLNQSLVADQNVLLKLYAFLEQEPPLNPLLMSFFSKTFGMLVAQKQKQDWFTYQYVCVTVLEFMKSRDGFLDTMLKHIGTPVIMDLLFHMITQIEGPNIKQSLLDWLNEQNLVEKLIRTLGTTDEAAAEKHNNIAQFLSEIIKTSRTKRQSEKQEGAIIDPLLQTLENEKTTKLLLDTILSENRTESSIIAGIKIILALLEDLVINEPADDIALQYLINAEKEHHHNVVMSLIQVIKSRVKDFHDLLLKPSQKPELLTTVNVVKTPPFGNTRLQVCCLFTVLIETENSDIINAICETDFFNTLLNLFKQYCWNNFLHNQVSKCLCYAFEAFDSSYDVANRETNLNLSALQKHIVVDCKITSKLIDCWLYNEEQQSQNKGRRLGYMGHLIKILDTLVSSYNMSENLCALIDSTLTDEELNVWKKLIDQTDGELAIEMRNQKRYLADWNPFQANESERPKDYYNENGDAFNELDANMHTSIDEIPNLANNDAFDRFLSSYISNDLSSSFLNSFKVWPENLDDNDLLSREHETIGFDGLTDSSWSRGNNDNGIGPLTFINPWGSTDQTSRSNIEPEPTSSSIDSGWADFTSANFADFDSHFTDFDVKTNNDLDTNVSKNNDEDINSNENNQHDSVTMKNNVTDNEVESSIQLNAIPIDNPNTSINENVKDISLDNDSQKETDISKLGNFSNVNAKNDESCSSAVDATIVPSSDIVLSNPSDTNIISENTQPKLEKEESLPEDIKTATTTNGPTDNQTIDKDAPTTIDKNEEDFHKNNNDIESCKTASFDTTNTSKASSNLDTNPLTNVVENGPA